MVNFTVDNFNVGFFYWGYFLNRQVLIFRSFSSQVSRQSSWKGAAQKSVDQGNRSGSPTASEASTKKSSVANIARKISPKSGASAPTKTGKSTAAAKKRGAFASRMSRLTKDQSFGPSGGLLVSYKIISISINLILSLVLIILIIHF